MTEATNQTTSSPPSSKNASISQQIHSQISPPKYHILFDFDKTITQNDTISQLALSSSQFHHNKPPTRSSYILQAWDECTKTYLQDYEAFKSTYPIPKERRTPEQEMEFQNALGRVDEASIRRVSDMGVYHLDEGMTDGECEKFWQDAGKRAVEEGSVVVRKGFVEFVAMLERSRRDGGREGGSSNWDVISINFCAAFVRGCVDAALDGVHVGMYEVLANRLDGRGIIRGPRTNLNITKPLISPSDKQHAMTLLINSKYSDMNRHAVSDHPTHPEDPPKIIYIGDSLTDLLCLQQADIGICIYDNGEGVLKEAFDHWDMRVRHISMINVETIGKGKVLCWARDFEEILGCGLFR